MRQFWERCRGYRTIGFSVAIAIPSLVCAFADQLAAAGLDWHTWLPSFLPTPYVGAAGLAISLFIVVCRVATTTQVFRRD